MQPQSFEPNPAFIVHLRRGKWLVFGLPLLFLGLAYYSGPDEDAAAAARGFEFCMWAAAMSALLAGATSFVLFRLERRLRTGGVTVDDDGIWPSHLSKELGLIPWSQIQATRQRPVLQRLDLRSAKGETLLEVEGNLLGFEILRAIIVDKALNPSKSIALPAEFSRPLSYHAFRLAIALGFGLLAGVTWYFTRETTFARGNRELWLALFLLAGLIAISVLAIDYLQSPIRVSVSRDKLIIRFPLRSRFIASAEFGDVKLFDHGSSRPPAVYVYCNDTRRPIGLVRFGVEPICLLKTIAAAMKPPPNAPGTGGEVSAGDKA